jgi:replicative DNA helicase
LNIASILLKKILDERDVDTWARIRKHYLPAEYHAVYNFVDKHIETHSDFPSFDDIRLSVRNESVLSKFYAIMSAEDVDVENEQLLEYLKNEYTQQEIMDQLEEYLDSSVTMSTAQENVDKIHQIILHVEDRVELKDPDQDMQRIELFDDEEDLAKMFSLGLNDEFDSLIQFHPQDYILAGGRRGAGKSLTCANIAVNAYRNNKSSLYFTIEMPSRSILQRMCAIATGVSAGALRRRNLSVGEWELVAEWWAGRFDGGEEAFAQYKKHRSFDQFHAELVKKHHLHEKKQLDVIYDPYMSLGKIRTELDKKVAALEPSVIIVDYINQVKRGNSRNGQYDWTEQIEVSKALKALAQEYEIPVFSPYQVDITGEARFAKGILDSADAAFSLDAHTKDDKCITFNCVKMRDNDEISFTSKVDWQSLRIGPESAPIPGETDLDEVHDI